MRKVQTGKLDKPIVFMREVAGTEVDGQPNGSWVDVVKVWASVEAVSGTELFTARQTESQVTHWIRIYYREDVRANAPRWRIRFRDRIFEIIEAHEVEENQVGFMNLMCKERLPRGDNR